ncbi:PREDICTED: trans-resveratrol di-O-methyltransferase-like [Ipomoea nil]|uniref:trans-resveratrol di-O-methyltransferase-like n=1 Tax=Ipomoea nil TaxID=35883 RepID=UPI000901DB46|nr:PREDICTED: trans-resveratrol di-O-methyltransferase-like [Ipomoea nil]
MGENGKQSHVELLQAEAQTWNHILNYIDSATLKCAVQLGIPDIIHNHPKPMPLCDLIAALPIHPSKAPYIHRLTRFLVHSGLLSVTNSGQEECYSLTPAGRLVVKDEPINLRAFLHICNEYVFQKSCYSLGDWFQNNDPSPFCTAHGEKIWDYISHEPGYNDVFNEVTAKDSQLLMIVLLSGESKRVFDGVSSLVDVAGGKGAVASAIAKCFPAMKCTVLDLPHVIASVDAASVENVEFVAGNMFENIPAANAVLLKWIMHDWEDEECVKILKKCKEAIPSREEGGKVIIIDMVIEDKKHDPCYSRAELYMDLLVMALYGSKERNKKQWEKLISEAGFSDYKITPALGLRSLIELFP